MSRLKGSVVEEEREEEVTQPADTKHLTPSVDAEQQHQENRTKTAFNLPTDNCLRVLLWGNCGLRRTESLSSP